MIIYLLEYPLPSFNQIKSTQTGTKQLNLPAKSLVYGKIDMVEIIKNYNSGTIT